jgi:hypothetical protein
MISTTSCSASFLAMDLIYDMDCFW